MTPLWAADTLNGEMSKTVLIVEKDLALMRSLRETLEHRGFGVEETTDGKGAPELVRRRRPDCVVLAVDLDAGQNGYIICKKLKSEDDLKGVPVVIIGDPKGFVRRFMTAMVLKMFGCLIVVVCLVFLAPRAEAIPWILCFALLYLAFLAFSVARLMRRSKRIHGTTGTR